MVIMHAGATMCTQAGTDDHQRFLCIHRSRSTSPHGISSEHKELLYRSNMLTCVIMCQEALGAILRYFAQIMKLCRLSLVWTFFCLMPGHASQSTCALSESLTMVLPRTLQPARGKASAPGTAFISRNS